MKPMLVVLEGIDNCGKTTQISLIPAELEKRGIPCSTTKELTTPIGNKIKHRFKKGNFSPLLKTIMFAVDRLERQKEIVKPALKEGRVVLADRWTLSAVVYRGVEGIKSWFVYLVNFLVLKPDIIIVIDVSSETSMERGIKSGKYCPYNQKFLTDARKKYLKIAESEHFPVVNGELPTETVTNEILKILGLN